MLFNTGHTLFLMSDFGRKIQCNADCGEGSCFLVAGGPSSSLFIQSFSCRRAIERRSAGNAPLGSGLAAVKQRCSSQRFASSIQSPARLLAASSLLLADWGPQSKAARREPWLLLIWTTTETPQCSNFQQQPSLFSNVISHLPFPPFDFANYLFT